MASDKPFENLVLLAPCHGIEDFPLYHTGDDAASLLACWTSLWHPVLLASAKRVPRIERCDYPSDDLANGLFVLPKPCEGELAEDLPEQIEAAGSHLIRDTTHDRRDILREALAFYDHAGAVDADLVEDFLAFGFVLLQVELLTQQMRYASSIDPSRIERLIFEAAQLAVTGDVAACKEKLTAGHDALADERNHYYPVDVFLLDLTLLAPSTLGTGFQQQLTDTTPSNILASARLLETMQQQNPELTTLVREAVSDGRLGVAGGEYDELPLPLMTPDTAARQMQSGLATWQSLLEKQPQTFARRRTGIYPSLSYLLQSAGFHAALHLRFDEGSYPESSQSKSHWAVDATEEHEIFPILGRQPLDANAHHTFLELPRELSDSMDTDFVAVRTFWHWAGHTTPWYQDLRRASRYGAALGEFVTLEDFFARSGDTTASDDFAPSQYRYPFLRQATQRSEIPQRVWSKYWRGAVASMVAEGMFTMAKAISPHPIPDEEKLRESLQSFAWTNDLLAGPNASSTNGQGTPNDTYETSLEQPKDQLKTELAQRLVGATQENPDDDWKTILNPLPFARRILLQSDDVPKAGSGASVYAASVKESSTDSTSNTLREGLHRTLVDVPGMGFACVQCKSTSLEPLAGPQLAEPMDGGGIQLHNEFFHAVVDEITGALRSIRSHQERTTRLSQQLALRITIPKTGQHWVDRQAPVGYSVMAADQVQITANGKVYAEVTSSGRMLAPNGDLVGRFVQRFQITRGSRILNMEVDITPQAELLLENEPWDSYYACRLAFADETAIVLGGRHFQSVELSGRRIVAPQFVHLDCPQHQTTLFCDGIPFHRRVAPGQLDTLLIQGDLGQASAEVGDGQQPVKERRGNVESADAAASATASEPWNRTRHFRMGLGIDVPTPTVAAIDWMAQAQGPLVCHGKANAASGWCFHVTAKNILISSWSAEATGEVRLRVIETTGRRTKCALHALRPWATLQRIQLDGEARSEIEIVEGAGRLSLAPYEIMELRGRFT